MIELGLVDNTIVGQENKIQCSEICIEVLFSLCSIPITRNCVNYCQLFNDGMLGHSHNFIRFEVRKSFHEITLFGITIGFISTLLGSRIKERPNMGFTGFTFRTIALAYKIDLVVYKGEND